MSDWELQPTGMSLAFVQPGNSSNRPFIIVSNSVEQPPDGCLSIDNEMEGEVSINRGSGNAQHPLHIGTNTTNGNGARLTAAGVWTNASSRKNKKDIKDISPEDALKALNQLNPVTYVGKQDKSKELYAGFIAEDMPEIVATADHEGVAAIEVVAVVTRVVKEQQKELQKQQEEIQQLQNDKEELVERLEALEQSILQMQK